MDTSTDTASLALVHEGQILAEMTWCCQQNHTTQLLPNLQHLLDQTGVSLQSVDSITVARGPGSYNGLRIGVSTAKGLAFNLGIPVVGISTLEAEAYQHAATGLPICPILNAGRDEIATALYQLKDGVWHQIATEHLTTIDALCAQITNKTVFCGEYVSTITEYLVGQLEEKAVIVPQFAGLRRAAFLAELGLKRLKAGDHDDPTTLQPVYMRGPSITKPKRPWQSDSG
ncbi:MAG: tRNA (adenosine(37)-N6)-threonylcarbamoyltransferase complex dimerization subunit type 1 TsaB [Dehalococcoidales bacterium]|nr:MAG: tRNA (adenosine(37)-N6)-threonylcarbamoyltransferase complex dimerization subunit type 1 TsaB [Dehalococcoidales bacterium]